MPSVRVSADNEGATWVECTGAEHRQPTPPTIYSVEWLLYNKLNIKSKGRVTGGAPPRGATLGGAIGYRTIPILQTQFHFQFRAFTELISSFFSPLLIVYSQTIPNYKIRGSTTHDHPSTKYSFLNAYEQCFSSSHPQ